MVGIRRCDSKGPEKEKPANLHGHDCGFPWSGHDAACQLGGLVVVVVEGTVGLVPCCFSAVPSLCLLFSTRIMVVMTPTNTATVNAA